MPKSRRATNSGYELVRPDALPVLLRQSLSIDYFTYVSSFFMAAVLHEVSRVKRYWQAKCFEQSDRFAHHSYIIHFYFIAISLWLSVMQNLHHRVCCFQNRENLELGYVYADK